MTKEEILTMKAGEDLDKLVAIEVVGEPMPELTPENALTFQLAGSPVRSLKNNWLCLCKYEEGDIPTWRPLPFSTDISVAWQVVKMMIKEGYSFAIRYQHAHECWLALLSKKWHPGDIKGQTAPEAICKASLIAKIDK